MTNIRRAALLLLVFGLSLQSAAAQMRGWEVGGWGGGSNYFGDLNTNWRVNSAQPAGGLLFRYNMNDRLAFSFGPSIGSITADDADSRNIYEQRRNLNFTSRIVDFSSALEFNFLPYVHGSRELNYSPYMFLGATFFNFNPQTEYEGEIYNLRELGTEGQFQGDEYTTTQFAFNYGIGLKYDFSYRWSIDVHLSGRKLFTDYLDDVSGVYADIRDVRSLRGEIAAALADRSQEPFVGVAGHQRGNGKSNDTYVFLGIGINYYFGQIRCPGMRD